MEGERLLSQYEKKLKEMEIENQYNHIEYEITESFPPKLPLNLRFMFDCRMKIFAYENTHILPGEIKYVKSSTIISSENGGWSSVYILKNTNLNLSIYEAHIQPSQTSQRIFVKVANTSTHEMYLCRGICFAYLLLE